MHYDPQKHHRHSTRLQGYDYSQPGAYFVTIVTWQREMLLGEIVETEMESGSAADMRLNPFGQIVRQAWFDLPNHYPHVELGSFCIMPNHVHAVIILTDPTVGAGLRPAPTGPAPTVPTECCPLSEIVRAFKSFSARRINELRQMPGVPVWQRNYFEHIIRNDEEHNRIHLYIEANAANWHRDAENPGSRK